MGFLANLRRSLGQWLLNAGGISKLEFEWGVPPKVKFSLDKSEYAAMLATNVKASRVLAETFCKRMVFWCNPEFENHGAILESLGETERELSEFDRSFSQTSDLSSFGYSKVVQAWNVAVSHERKNLRDRIKDIDQEKAQVLGYEDSNSDKHSAGVNAAIEVRIASYPYVRMLIDFLDDGDIIKEKAISLFNQGLKFIPTQSAIGLIPHTVERAR